MTPTQRDAAFIDKEINEEAKQKSQKINTDIKKQKWKHIQHINNKKKSITNITNARSYQKAIQKIVFHYLQ